MSYQKHFIQNVSRCGSLGTNVNFCIILLGAITLQEAVSIIENWPEDEEVDAVIIPPDTDALSDNEQIDENILDEQEIGDIAGQIEVVTHSKYMHIYLNL